MAQDLEIAHLPPLVPVDPFDRLIHEQGQRVQQIVVADLALVDVMAVQVFQPGVGFIASLTVRLRGIHILQQDSRISVAFGYILGRRQLGGFDEQFANGGNAVGAEQGKLETLFK